MSSMIRPVRLNGWRLTQRLTVVIGLKMGEMVDLVCDSSYQSELYYTTTSKNHENVRKFIPAFGTQLHPMDPNTS